MCGLLFKNGKGLYITNSEQNFWFLASETHMSVAMYNKSLVLSLPVNVNVKKQILIIKNYKAEIQ